MRPAAAPALNPPDLSAAFARGTLWSVGLRWSMKAIGLVSTVILARLLAPEDFGIVAMAMLCIGFVEVFFAVSTDAVLLRDANASRELIDSAWTLRLLESLCVAAAVAAVSPFVADFFREPRLMPVVLVLCIGIVISGFGSYGPLLARKELDFSLEVRLAIMGKAITFVCTVALAWWLRSYWALVIGTVIGYTSGVALSYIFHRYRSRFTLCRLREIWSFSQWMLVMSIGQFFARKTDELLVGRLGVPAELGMYSVASDLGQTVSYELSAPMNRALLPVLAQIGNTGARLKDAVMKSLGVSNTLILPAGFGLAAVSDQFVRIFLGSQWLAAAPMLAIFAIAWSVRMMTGPYSAYLVISGNARAMGILTWVEAIVLGVLGIALVTYGVYGLVWARAATNAVSLVVWIVAGTLSGLALRDFVRAAWRPLVGAIAMYVALRLLPDRVPYLWDIADLALRVLLGASLYTAWIVATWRLAKRPDGIESRVLGALRGLAARSRGDSGNPRT